MNLARSVRNVMKLLAQWLTRPRDVTWFLASYQTWQRTATEPWKASFDEFKTCLSDRHAAAGSAKGHYFLQDIWAAQRVYQFTASEHVDVGSRVDGFVGHVVSFCPVTYVDIRALTTGVPQLKGMVGNVCELPFADQSVASLSCLHVIEHIGLGRYGDPIDAEGWLKGLRELQRVLKPGGQLLIGTPCGRQRVVFHAHRVFGPQTIVDALPELRLKEFSMIRDDEATSWQENVALNSLSELDYACGLFVFMRD